MARRLPAPQPFLARHAAAMTAACFFVSGVPALALQVLWARAFTRVFGSATYAVATVLAAFMVGLACGSLIGARVADRHPRPLRLYALLELSIGAFAVASLPLIATVGRAVDGWLADAGSVRRTAGLFAASFLLLLLPTALMGATFPLLASLADRTRSVQGASIELLYGVNTLGAAVGALSSGFLLMPYLGMRWTAAAAASCNLGVAALAMATGRALPDRAPPNAAPSRAAPSPRALLTLLFLAASGASTSAYEIVFARVTALTFGSSAYAFSLVLAAFLWGIGLGSLLYERTVASEGPERAAQGLPLLAAMGGFSMILIDLLVGKLPIASIYLHRAIGSRFGLLQASTFAALFVLLLVPSTVLGMTFPAAIEGVAAALGGTGRGAGIGTLANTLGAASGAVLVGFLCLPWMGLEPVLRSAAVLSLACGALVSLAMPKHAARRGPLILLASAAALLAAFGPTWRRDEMAEGVFRYYSDYPSYRALRKEMDARKLVFYRDGPSSSVAVFQTFDPEGRSLRVNGKADASTIPQDLQTQYLLAHLPALLHGSPRRALVIGLGSGSTAHALAEYPSIGAVDVAELEPAVLEAERFFRDINGDVLQDPKVHVFIEDGRRFVDRAERESYDLIVSEPSNPWVAGVADLYTREHFERAKAALAGDGILVQWIHGYNLSPRWIACVLHTVADAFPETSLWFANKGDYLVVASRKPVALDIDRVRRTIADLPAVARDLSTCRMYGPRGLCSRFLMGPSAVRRESADAPVMRDDLPLLEYFAPRDLHTENTVVRTFQDFAAKSEPCPCRAGPVPKEEEALEWTGMAVSADLDDFYAAAVDAYRAALKITQRPTLYLGLAKDLKQLGRQQDAVEAAARGLALRTADAETEKQLEELVGL